MQLCKLALANSGHLLIVNQKLIEKRASCTGKKGSAHRLRSIYHFLNWQASCALDRPAY